MSPTILPLIDRALNNTALPGSRRQGATRACDIVGTPCLDRVSVASDQSFQALLCRSPVTVQDCSHMVGIGRWECKMTSPSQ